MAEHPSWADRPWERSPSTAPTPGGADDPQPPPPKRGKGCVLGCLGMVALVIVLAVSCSFMGGNGGDSPPTSFEAERQCQAWVRDQLRAPSTAEFSQTTSTGGSSSWAVSGVVDAENGFGAMLRTSWTCDIRLDGDTWRGNAVLLD